jgi:ABC-type transporter Mla subunit MlaD
VKISLTSRERVAGLFLVGAALMVAAFVIGAAVTNEWLARRVRFHAHVTRGDGLRAGSPVLLSGIEVGRIGEMAILPDAGVDLELVVLEKFASHVRPGTRVVVRRFHGIGEKRVHLEAPAGSGPPLPSGSVLPADEPTDLVDALTAIDLGRHLQTVDRAVRTVDLLLAKLGEEGRVDRALSALDRLDPAVAKLDRLLGEIHGPLVALLADPSLRDAVHGADAVLNDPATRASVRSLAAALEPGRLDRLLVRTEGLVARLESTLAEDGAVQSAFAGADRLVNDPRTERLLATLDRLSDEQKLARLVDNVATLAEEMARVGPEIPALTRETLVTMREAVIVLKALQESWLLDSQSRRAREQLDRAPAATPVPTP